MINEASATMDEDIEALVMRTIEEAFKDCTVIIIAH